MRICRIKEFSGQIKLLSNNIFSEKKSQREFAKQWRYSGVERRSNIRDTWQRRRLKAGYITLMISPITTHPFTKRLQQSSKIDLSKHRCR